MFRIVSALRELARRFQEFARSFQPEIVRAEMELLGDKIVEITRQELAPVKDTGELEQSITKYVQSGPGYIRVDVSPTAPHTPYVRYGTEPHWVPIEPLKAWAARKLGDEKAAYAVRWNIHLHGTSAWAERLYGTKSNPFPMRVMQRTDTKGSVEWCGIQVRRKVRQGLFR